MTRRVALVAEGISRVGAVTQRTLEDWRWPMAINLDAARSPTRSSSSRCTPRAP